MQERNRQPTSNQKSWREIAAPIIAGILEATEGKDPSLRKKRLFEAYPFGERQYHPYKIWLDEIKVQTGKRKWRGPAQKENPNQSSLF